MSLVYQAGCVLLAWAHGVIVGISAQRYEEVEQMSNGYLLLFGVVCALAALFWGVLAQANHVVRWWVAAGAFAVVAVALLLAAALQSGSLTLGAQAFVALGP